MVQVQAQSDTFKVCQIFPFFCHSSEKEIEEMLYAE